MKLFSIINNEIDHSYQKIKYFDSKDLFKWCIYVSEYECYYKGVKPICLGTCTAPPLPPSLTTTPKPGRIDHFHVL